MYEPTRNEPTVLCMSMHTMDDSMESNLTSVRARTGPVVCGDVMDTALRACPTAKKPKPKPPKAQ